MIECQYYECGSKACLQNPGKHGPALLSAEYREEGAAI